MSSRYAWTHIYRAAIAAKNCSLKVLLHTLMEYLRDDEVREVNHHGTTMEVDGDQKLFKNVNRMMDGEDNTKKATSIVNTRSRSSFYMKLCQFAATRGIPIVLLTFSTVYWSFGLYSFFYPSVLIDTQLK